MLLRNAIYAAAYEGLYHIAGECNEPISQPNEMRLYRICFQANISQILCVDFKCHYSADSELGLYIHFVAVFFDVRQTHTCTEAECTDAVGCG